MIHLTGDMGPTISMTRREYVYLGGLRWDDGRDGTLFLSISHAKRRRNTKTDVSRYAVSEVKEVGFAGRTFVLDKEVGEPESEHCYTVRIDQHGSPWCRCTASDYRVNCKHIDAVLTLIDQCAFDDSQLKGV